MSPRVKICGLTDAQGVAAALDAGASYLGFVIFERSPRHLTPEAAARLALPAPSRGVFRVAVLVDPSDALLEEIADTLRPDFIQLHGAETPARVHQAKVKARAMAIKALAVSSKQEALDGVRRFDGAAEHLLYEPKPPDDAGRPGGNGVALEFGLLQGISTPRPWFLAGGLTPWNVREAVKASGAPMVDVSSGVERAPGIKNPALISAFISAVQTA